jgi:hypothetical protein
VKRGHHSIVDAVSNGVVGWIIAIVGSGLIPWAFSGFRADAEGYENIDLAGAAAVFGLCLAIDGTWLLATRVDLARRALALRAVPYVASIGIFVGLTIAGGSTEARSSTPIFLALAMLLLGHLVRLVNDLSLGRASGPSTGLAATGLLVVHHSGEDQFLLVLNRNLNGGHGLWVPPGGHFDPEVDEPAERLIAKIRTEVCRNATIWSPDSLARPDSLQLSTAETRWLSPPLFLLDEDLLGQCSHGHLRHLDLVYACRDAGAVAGTPKYGPADRIYVRVSECALSAADAEQALRKAVEEWEEGTTGLSHSVPATVSRDVAQRLYLVGAAWAGGSTA